jgi:hypothetical protein
MSNGATVSQNLVEKFQTEKDSYVCEIARRMFAEALARRDVQSRMEEFYAAQLPNLPPEAA